MYWVLGAGEMSLKSRLSLMMVAGRLTCLMKLSEVLERVARALLLVGGGPSQLRLLHLNVGDSSAKTSVGGAWI